jgi:hypothetical protein
MSETNEFGGSAVAAAKDSVGSQKVYYCLRNRKNGRAARKTRLGKSRVVVFDERRVALAFRRTVIGQQQGRGDWKVSEIKIEVNKDYWLAYDNGFEVSYLGMMVSPVSSEVA